MGLFDITFSNLKDNILPPNYRTAVHKFWILTWTNVIQYLRDRVLGDYRTGSNYPEWTAGTYAIHDKVIYNQVVYESQEDGNTDTLHLVNGRFGCHHLSVVTKGNILTGKGRFRVRA